MTSTLDPKDPGFASTHQTESLTLDDSSLVRRLVMDRYQVLSHLGRGGMGDVWHAYDMKLRVDVALKSIRLDKGKPIQAVDYRRPGMDTMSHVRIPEHHPLEVLRREVRSAREVISPNVCRVFDLVTDADYELISMEYIDGITLRKLLAQKSPLELKEARTIAAQFLAGLDAIHQAGLVHRDFKPENVMITRAGRVVVMDFGLAKHATPAGGTISGTPAYMAPEQMARGSVDARCDIYAAGIVLAEMVHPDGVRSKESLEKLWSAIHLQPPHVEETPWKGPIVRAASVLPQNRFSSAAALSRALEEETQRVETVEDHRPYPGLASFTEGDSEFFFGRELEVETVIKRLQHLHLMALIGPSGAGKTSFLHAGLIPALPSGWSFAFCTPGEAPLANLGRSLVPELSGDTEAMRRMVRLEDADTAMWLLHRWKKNHPEALLIVDRFEELFTLNPPEAQSIFADLIGRAALEADVRVLIALRDDFLFRCSGHGALAVVFSELTPLAPLSGVALRRALVQPALRCGYHFEDEGLVEEMLAEVEKERGALPLMAFAAARLWEKRDRTSGRLTREAYKEIGGVAGALARHAEITMERIGGERQPIVREIFRNLITAQGTRAARDLDDLLSVFPDKSVSEDVLHILVDARLLTSFEAPAQEGEQPRRRVEIIHESLLTTWPRLVRWQTQDADGVQLRDQLRQAARMWEERNRSQDLLWTGTAYLEFQAWRERYSGGLTATEEAFARAMTQRATRRRRQRRTAVAAVFAGLIGILAVISYFWRGAETARQQSDVSRKQAVSEAQRAEASRLLAFAQLHQESYPTAALAYAIKSLEVSDTLEARLFALRMIQQAPPAMLMPAPQAQNIKFSPDGRWIAVGGYRGASVTSYDRKEPVRIIEYPSKGFNVCRVQFGPNSDRLFTALAGDISVSSFPVVRELHHWRLASEGTATMYRAEGGMYIAAEDSAGLFVYFSAGYAREPQLLGVIPEVGVFDLAGMSLIHTLRDGRKVYLRSVKDWKLPPRVVLEQTDRIEDLAVNPGGKQFATIDASGRIRIWPLDQTATYHGRPLREMQSTGLSFIRYDPTGRRLAAGGGTGSRPTVHIWDLTAPAGSRYLDLGRTDTPFLNGWDFDPSGNWLATANVLNAALWRIPSEPTRTLSGAGMFSATFTPDGRRLLSAGTEIRSWPLSGSLEEEPRVIMRDEFAFPFIKIDAGAMRFAVNLAGGRVAVANLDGTGRRTLEGFSSDSVLIAVAFSPDGRRVAAGPHNGPREDKVLRVWDLESGRVDILGPLAGAGEGFDGGIFALQFLNEHEVLASGKEGLQLFDIRNKTGKILSDRYHQGMAISQDRRFLFTSECDLPQPAGPCTLVRTDLLNNNRVVLKSFGDCRSIALDATDELIATGSVDGLVRVGKIQGGEPHIIFGHKGVVDSVAFSPDGHWIASAARDQTVRMTPVPDLAGRAPHTLPHDELLAKLMSFTNLRVIQDKQSSSGWKLDVGPFPGWEKEPGR